MNRVAALFLLGTLAGCSSAPEPNLDSTDPYERYLGALSAAESGDAEGLKRLDAQLKDGDALARTGAIVALSIAKPAGALERITGMLNDPDPIVRAEAVRGITRFRDPASTPALVKVLSADASVEPRRTAARELCMFTDTPEVRTALLTAFSDPAAGVAYNAWRSLMLLTGRRDLPRTRADAEEALKKS
jgi:HEAT repeat protein